MTEKEKEQKSKRKRVRERQIHRQRYKKIETSRNIQADR